MPEPKIAGKQPVDVQLEAGKNYALCSCGLSNNQPFCDGSHAGTDLTPQVFAARSHDMMAGDKLESEFGQSNRKLVTQFASHLKLWHWKGRGY